MSSSPEDPSPPIEVQVLSYQQNQITPPLQPPLQNAMVPINQHTLQMLTGHLDTSTLVYWINFFRPFLAAPEDQMFRESARLERPLLRSILEQAPTDPVPDEEWEKKIVKYCRDSQFYKNWKYGRVGLDSVINPNGPRKFPQPVWKPPFTSKNLFNLVTRAKGESHGSDEAWRNLSDEEQMAYAEDLVKLKKEARAQAVKGWVVPERRLRSYKARMNREKEMSG